MRVGEIYLLSDFVPEGTFSGGILISSLSAETVIKAYFGSRPYTLVGTPTVSNAGTMYGFDSSNKYIISVARVNFSYRLPTSSTVLTGTAFSGYVRTSSPITTGNTLNDRIDTSGGVVKNTGGYTSGGDSSTNTTIGGEIVDATYTEKAYCIKNFAKYTLVAEYYPKRSTSSLYSPEPGQGVTISIGPLKSQTVYSSQRPKINSGNGQVTEGACVVEINEEINVDPDNVVVNENLRGPNWYCLNNTGGQDAVFEIYVQSSVSKGSIIPSLVTVSYAKGAKRITGGYSATVSANQGGRDGTNVFSYDQGTQTSVQSYQRPKIVSAEVNYWYGSGNNTPNYLAYVSDGACSTGGAVRSYNLLPYCVRVTVSHQVKVWETLDSKGEPVQTTKYITAGNATTVYSYFQPLLTNQSYGSVTPGVGSVDRVVEDTTPYVPPTTPVPPRVIVDPGPPPAPPPPPPPVPPLQRWLLPIKLEDRFINLVEDKIEGVFSDNEDNLTTYYSSSDNQYYLHVYDKNTADREIQFSIAYGNYNGSGSEEVGGLDRLTPSNAIYRQYKNICITGSKFSLDGRDLNSIYVLNFQKLRLKNQLDYGHFEINLAHLSGSQFEETNNRNAHTGSNVKLKGDGSVLRLIDSGEAFTIDDGGEVYYIVSGSLESGIYNKTNPHKYGLMYPKLGTVILDGDLLDVSASFLTVTGSEVSGSNSLKIFTSISGAALYQDSSGDYLGMKGRRLVKEYSNYYYIRVPSKELNYSNNPTFISGSEYLVLEDFRTFPKVYISTIGLYNSNRELLAAGRISRPTLKTFIDEGLFKVKIKF